MKLKVGLRRNGFAQKTWIWKMGLLSLLWDTWPSEFATRRHAGRDPQGIQPKRYRSFRARWSASLTWRPVLTGGKAPGEPWASSSRVRGQSNRRETRTADAVAGYKRRRPATANDPIRQLRHQWTIFTAFSLYEPDELL